MERIDINLAKIKKYGKNFEIVVDADKAIEYKRSKGNLAEVLNSPEIFSDAQKGMVASPSDLEEVFGTIDKDEVAKKILSDGEIQLSAEYRKKLRERKEKNIISLIHKNCIDPRTKAPLPITRIKNALEHAKIKIDYMKSAEDQFEEIIKKIKLYMPIRIDKTTLQITVPAHYTGKAYGFIKKIGKLIKEDWTSKGEFLGKLVIPSGIEYEIIDKINKITDGNATIEKEN